MSSRLPSQAALNKAINGSTDQTSTQVRARPIREACPTQKAQYITDERREREHQRQKGKGKTTWRNVETRGKQLIITSRDVELRTPNTGSNPPLDLRPQSGRVPPLTSSVRPKTKRTLTGFGNRDDIMTQSSGFINAPEGYSVGPPAKRMLTSTRANELMDRRRVLAQGLFPQNEEADGELGAAPEGYRELMDRRRVLAQDLNTQKDMDTDEPDGQGDEELSDGSQPQDATNEGYDESNPPSSHTWGHNSLDGESDALDDSEDVHAAGPGMGRGWDFDAGDVSGSDRHGDASLDNGEHGRKHAQTSVDSSNDQDPDALRHPQKIRATTGRVAAKDYEVAVREILKVAIGRFRSRLTAENAYPDRIEQVKWAKEAWTEGCKVCDTQINFNNEIIQLVRVSRLSEYYFACKILLTYARTQITNRTWHLTSELKMKIRPLTEAIYGFESSTKRAIQANNRKLVEDLIEDFGLCYRVRFKFLFGNMIPRSY
ncbi:hypothetical protein JVT61DRAFT_2537 [Boletus reticuloceps]|uniref:DUF6532 domain-containing protein n=1 Tax=Boletus reticuloceps TaxID=495285 RepID=A0A8I2YRI0_9AGAM|nr:hypothetical protein JVT61DRAFT_2537 [Boletus reticuloceps]